MEKKILLVNSGSSGKMMCVCAQKVANLLSNPVTLTFGLLGPLLVHQVRECHYAYQIWWLEYYTWNTCSLFRFFLSHCTIVVLIIELSFVNLFIMPHERNRVCVYMVVIIVCLLAVCVVCVIQIITDVVIGLQYVIAFVDCVSEADFLTLIFDILYLVYCKWNVM